MAIEVSLFILIAVIVVLLLVAVVLLIILVAKRRRLRHRKFELSNADKSGAVNASYQDGEANILGIKHAGQNDANLLVSLMPIAPHTAPMVQVPQMAPIPLTSFIDYVPSQAREAKILGIKQTGQNDVNLPVSLQEEMPIAPTPPPAVQVPQMDPIPLTSFIDYVGENKLNGALVDQWSSLPQDLTQPATVALRNENKLKNRYRNVIAYDEHRVVLDIIDGDNFSDYVNASYIKGYKNDRAYIASQGPTTNSILDFWRMVWQENLRKICMVANVIEEGRMKCLHYWPTLGDDPLVEGDFTVATETETERDSYTLRTLRLTKEGEEESRELHLFHYTEWPDRDVPADASTLTRYIKDVHSLDTPGPDTILIHCSAGAGRTGVLMAIDTQLKRSASKGDVDIFNFALEMRKARPWMVQMPIQYIFIHEAILEAIMCRDTLIHKSRLSALIDRFLEPQFETGKTLIEQHYQALNSVSVKVTDYFYKMQAGMKEGNVAKNRHSKLIPIDRFRPKLVIADEENDVQDYICATFLNRHMKVNGLMVTQMPLPSTITDFWQLIHDYKITALVMLNENDSVDETIGQYWPSSPSDILITDKYSVSEDSSEVTESYIIRDLTLKVMKEDDDPESEQEDELTLKQFQFLKWGNSSVNPSSSSALLDFILLIKDWMAGDVGETHLPLVHCMNGVGRSGVFCSVFNTLEQMEKSDSINIFNVIKALRRKQPLMVQTQDEYELIFRLVNEYIIRSEGDSEGVTTEERPADHEDQGGQSSQGEGSDGDTAM